MATATLSRSAGTTRLKTGPWKGVVTTTDPFDTGPDTLLDATNGYIPAPDGATGWKQRPGMSLFNGGDPVTTSATTFRGQGVITYTDLSLVTYNFVVFNGKLWRADAQFGAFEDVTPVGITIDAGVSTRVFGTPFGAQLIMTDGVNRPWLASNLSASPITGTYIDYDSAGTTWAAFGPFVEYAGSVFCILKQVNNVARRSDVSWSLPADASIGWQQTNYDFNWTLQQAATGTEPPALFALSATNTQLFYFRERSIGSLSGVPGPNLSGQATHDAISVNVGTMSPQSVLQFGNIIYFPDSFGRPYRLIAGGDQDPQPIWHQMRAIVDASSVGFPGVNDVVCTAAIDPTLNLYVIAPWTTIPAQQGPAVEGYIFDCRTGTYFGRFQIADGVQIETLGTFVDANGRGVLISLGSLDAPSGSLEDSGYVWGLNGIEALGETLTTEGGVELTTEDDELLTTEGTASNWMDNGETPVIKITTGLLGYSATEVIACDRATALVGTTSPVAVSAGTSAVAETVEGTPTPSTTQDGVYRLIAGFSGMQGRGVSVTLQPSDASAQWSAQQIIVDVAVSNALPDDV